MPSISTTASVSRSRVAPITAVAVAVERGLPGQEEQLGPGGRVGVRVIVGVRQAGGR